MLNLPINILKMGEVYVRYSLLVICVVFVLQRQAGHKRRQLSLEPRVDRINLFEMLRSQIIKPRHTLVIALSIIVFDCYI